MALERPTAWAQTGGGQGTYESLGHRRRDCSHICEGLLNSGGDAIFHSPTTPPPRPCQLPPARSDFSKKHGAFRGGWSHLHRTLPHCTWEAIFTRADLTMSKCSRPLPQNTHTGPGMYQFYSAQSAPKHQPQFWKELEEIGSAILILFFHFILNFFFFFL